MRPLVIEGPELRGQLTTTTEVEKFSGYKLRTICYKYLKTTLKEMVLMFQLRNQDRECTDSGKIHHFLEHAQTAFLGLSLENVPYVIPLNFVWLNNAIYFHGAAEGRKVTYIENNPLACFTIEESYGTITSPIPAGTDTAYMSVIIEGTIYPVTDLTEATEAMQVMLDKYVPGYYNRPLGKSHVERYVSPLGGKTGIYKLVADSVSAKEKEVILDRIFLKGKTIHSDRK